MTLAGYRCRGGRGVDVLVTDRGTAVSDHRVGGVVVGANDRLSTVRMADLILVFNDGELVETGSHGDLVAAGGPYSELFALQAGAYQ